MERLVGLDGMFLALESSTTHLHLVGALVFDPTGADGVVDYARVRRLVASRVHLVPPFRQRMVEVPFGVQHPAMVDDPEFDLDFHVRRRGIPAPGRLADLAELVADIASQPLDRRRPLWEFHVVEGLEGGRLALIPKVHHSIIDGVSAAEVLAAFFDLSADPAPRPLFGGGGRGEPVRDGSGRHPGTDSGHVAGPDPGDPSWHPDPVPGEVQRWRAVLASLPGAADAAVRTVTRTVQSARSLSGRNREVPGSLPPAPFEAPRTSVNRAISPRRRVAFAELPLADVTRVRSVFGGTTNDVVLTVVAGAMRTYFAERDEPLDRSLVALVPVSVRDDTERDALGNRLSAVLVSLSTGVEDGPTRLRHIRSGMGSAKDQLGSVGPEVFAGWAQALVPALATRVSRLVSNVRLFDHVAPVCNLIVSNVPGPDFPLYLAGARLEAMYPVGPIIEGVGINITVFSYRDVLYAGVQGCWELCPDLDVIARGLTEALAGLVGDADRRDRPVPWWHAELPA
jgi:WS/DGAT/MGAT family acyltransferase